MEKLQSEVDQKPPKVESAAAGAPNKEQENASTAQQQRDKEIRKGRDDTTAAEVCRNFLNNRCTRGSMCKFLHPMASAGTLAQKRSRSPITNDRTNICRDYARNLCTRGTQCRYFHPPVNQVEKHWFNICLDFQNGKCRRHDCRYFHIRSEDEDQFRHTGETSDFVFTQALRHALSFDGVFDCSTPVCKDFLKKFCNMRNCRFRHVNRTDFENEVYSCLLREMENVFGLPMRPPPPANLPYRPPKGRFDDYNEQYAEPEYYEAEEPEEDKLRHEVERLQSIINNSESPATEDLKQTNSKFISQNTELLEKVRFLTRENTRLMNDLRQEGCAPHEESDLVLRCKELESQNEQLTERYSKIKTEYFALENKKQAMDQFQSFTKDQYQKLIDHTHIFETEFLKMFHGGPPPILPLSDSWDQLKSTCNYIYNSVNKNFTSSSESSSRSLPIEYPRREAVNSGGPQFASFDPSNEWEPIRHYGPTNYGGRGHRKPMW